MKVSLRLDEVESERKSFEEKSTEFAGERVRERRADLARRLESWHVIASASELCLGDDILVSLGRL
jgi:hypothetical protein